MDEALGATPRGRHRGHTASLLAYTVRRIRDPTFLVLYWVSAGIWVLFL
jgi:hypothetical protein